MSNLLIKLFVKNHEDIKNITVRTNYGNLGSIVGILCNLFLCVLKITIGSITGSISITADGLNNLSDMGSSVITIIGFKLAGKPADSDHPFGHGRMEYISAFTVAFLIFLVGFELLKSSITALIQGVSSPTYSLWAVIILAVSILIKFWMFLFNRKIGKKINSNSLIATAQDSLNDMITTAVILLSAGATYVFDISFNLDAVMGIAVAIFILFSGYNTAKETLNSILGGPPEKELIDDIKTTVLSFKEFVGQAFAGGFDFESDPVRISEAIRNSEHNFAKYADSITKYSSEMHFLGCEIYNFVKGDIRRLRNKVKKG